MTGIVRLINPNLNIDLEQLDCCNCGVVFAMPSTLLAQKRNHGGNFHCPNGHSMTYTESELDRVKKRLENAIRDANEQRIKVAQERTNAERERQRADKLAKEQARQKKRAAAGLCSCCNRTFANLARHMATKHKEPKA